MIRKSMPSGHDPMGGSRFSLATNAERVCAEIVLKQEASLSACLFQRADHRIDHATGQKIHRSLAAELVARATLDQPRSEPALHGSRDGRTAGFAPDHPQLALGVVVDGFPVQRDAAGVVRERAIFGG